MKKKLFSLFLLVLTCFHVHGQLCNGSLGDPVVNITFGNDQSPAGPLRAGVTNLSYTKSGCPNDGEYTITNLSLGCFGNGWFLLAGDHTRDIGGRYMLINASIEPSDFYVDTVGGLCGNTVYELAAWVCNVLKPTSCGGAGIKPNLTFKIETVSGKVLQQFNSGDIASGNEKTWKQFGTFFTMPAGSDKVVLRISNNSKGGCGNDLMLDDITFRPCGSTITATVNNLVQPLIDICENNKSSFLFTTSFPSNYSLPVVQWQISTDTGKTWKDIAGEKSLNYTRKPTGGGSFQYRAVMAEAGNFSSVSCRIASNVTVINVNPLPDITNAKNLMGCTGSDFRLEAVDGTAFTYQWSGPNGFNSQVRNPFLYNVTNADSGLYTVLVKTDAACSRTDSFHIAVFPGTKAVVSAGGNMCEGSSMALSASGGLTYVWTPASGLSDSSSANPIASPVDTTTYKVVVANQYGCKDSAQVLVNVFKKLIVNAGPDKAIFEGDTVLLNGTIRGTPVDIYWLPDSYIQNSHTVTPVVNPADNTVYTLYAASGLGCAVESDDAFVRVYKKLRIPNIFSPNGDGINDTWIIQNLDTYPLAFVRVFSRSGRVVFEAKAVSKTWDGTLNGKPLPVGTYYYLIDLNIGTPVQSGWVVILR